MACLRFEFLVFHCFGFKLLKGIHFLKFKITVFFGLQRSPMKSFPRVFDLIKAYFFGKLNI